MPKWTVNEDGIIEDKKTRKQIGTVLPNHPKESRLILAAPEMLAALQVVYEDLLTNESFDNTEYEPLREQAKAAIDAATKGK